MATSRQEKTYNDIIEYYNYADSLIQEAESATHEGAQEQFEIVEKVVENIEKCADQLTSKYIEYVKSGKKDDLLKVSSATIKEVLVKIEECRNGILAIYKKPRNA